MLAVLAQALHVALVLAAAPVLVGAIRLARARLAGGAGGPLLQPWHDLLRLARKQPAISEGAGPVFLAAAQVEFAASLAAAALVPSFALGMATAPVADLLLIAFLLLLAEVARVLGALDAGTPWDGLAAGRALAGAVVGQAAVILVVFALALATGTTNLDAIGQGAARGANGLDAAFGLALAALLITAWALREPAAASEQSGWRLALAEWAAALRLLAWLSLAVVAFAPYGAVAAAGLPLLWPLGLLAWGAKLAVLALGLALAETVGARLAPRRMVTVLSVAAALALLAVLLLCAGQGVA